MGRVASPGFIIGNILGDNGTGTNGHIVPDSHISYYERTSTEITVVTNVNLSRTRAFFSNQHHWQHCAILSNGYIFAQPDKTGVYREESRTDHIGRDTQA